MKKKSLLIPLTLITALTLSSCTTQNAYTGQEQTSNATKGAFLGALGGAALGALTGGGNNAAIGAVLGAGIGASVGHSQDEQEAALRNSLRGSGVRIQRNGDSIKLIMNSDVTFQVNKANIEPNFKEVLHNVAVVLVKFNNSYVRIAGFTDNTGTAQYNLGLSKRRAAAVRNFLQAQGVRPNRLVNIGYGEKDPVASNATAQGRAMNRRVEINLVPIQR
jgi:outer membrane protein OmpA-like peptidoglycan-associated protein